MGPSLELAIYFFIRYMLAIAASLTISLYQFHQGSFDQNLLKCKLD